MQKGFNTMAVNIKSDGLTKNEREFLYGDTKDKNHIDNNYYFHITPQMQEMFTDHAGSQPLTVFRDKNGLAFSMVDIDNCPVRKLSPSEFEAFPDSDKSSGSIIPRALLASIIPLIVFAAFFIFWIVSFKAAKEQNVHMITALGPLISGIVLFLFMRSGIESLRNQQITSDSEAAFGKAAFFRDDPNTEVDSHTGTKYVDVAFYGEKKLLPRVLCSRKVFDMLSQDSDVVVYGGKIYAYGKDGKLIVE